MTFIVVVDVGAQTLGLQRLYGDERLHKQVLDPNNCGIKTKVVYQKLANAAAAMPYHESWLSHGENRFISYKSA
jgi:hypothetical protein